MAPLVEKALKRDRAVAIGALVFVTALAWAWTLAAGEMDDGMAGMAVATRAAWSAEHALLMFAMWWIMMVAMMLPSAAPLVLLGLSLQRRGRAEDDAGSRGTTLPVWMVAGYLGLWGLFSAGATLVQWGLDAAGWLQGAGMRVDSVPAGIILLTAGLYQLTPAKRACLRHCRSPVRFVVEHWRPDAAGALRTGIAHGTYCVGCCWMLMIVLFAVGVMNPFWIGALALWVLIEKWSPHGERLRYAAGTLLIAAGLLILIIPF